LQRKVLQDLPVPQSLAAPSEAGAYVVPKGYFVLASPSVAGMDPQVWKNPTEWDPYRWVGSTSSSTGGYGAGAALKDEISGEKVDYGFGMISKGTESPYQPFGAGRHRCIGESFAYVQLGSIIATVVRNLELRLPAGKSVPPHNYHVSVLLDVVVCIGVLITLI
jgi:sterol 14alpha-demethylase